MPSYSREVKVPGRSATELFEKISAGIDRFMEKASVGKFEVERKPEARTVGVKSSMFSATLLCEEGCIRLEAKLSLMAVPFRSKIDEGIDKWVAKTFGA
jgi:hypothetical protein